MKLRNKKTGEIATLDSEHTDSLADFCRQTFDRSWDKEFSYDTLAELNEDWEDYKPVEPLIKDERIRKAVRAWAEVNDIEDGITYLGDGEFRSYLNTTIDFAILVNEHRFDLLKKNEDYTITELCGEEE